ncbi:MAG: metallophosphoesterase-domain-containing protein [Betaproteobacteria bacterium]|nr:MAG: metallophosphoesterase-domain-containing protein [Betaproteobacteria bacterium]
MPKVRFAVVTDIHHGADYGTKLGSSALPLLGRFRDWCAKESPELVLELGDRINNVSVETDTRLTAEVAAAFRDFPREVVHLLGNHDCHALTVEQAEAAFRKSFRSHSSDHGGFHFVFWNANVEKHPSLGFAATPADIDWLARDLAATDLPTVICSHMPLDGGSMAGNLYFEKGLSAGLGGYANSESVRTAIEASGKVVLCIAGHTHWNALAIIDGIPYVTVPALSEAFMSWPRPAAAWASLELGDDIAVRVDGEVPVEYRLPMRSLGAHWVNKDKDYAPRPPVRVVPKGR